MPQALCFATQWSSKSSHVQSQATVSMWKAITQHLRRSWMLPKAPDLQVSAPASLCLHPTFFGHCISGRLH